MHTSVSPVAILLFTRSAGEDAARKKLVSTGVKADNVAVVAQLIRHATATAQQVGADFLCVDSGRQAGATFGERLSGAMEQAFALGYEQLLVIGNDCPQLNPVLLRRALTVLATTGAVLGPATDGGVYLLGVARAHFEAAAWTLLPWQTAGLGQALTQRLQATGATVWQLPPLADVDTEQDLVRALRQPLPRRLSRTLRRLRQPAPAGLVWRTPDRYRLVFAPARPHRGPPNP